jgi:PAS domain S-box-containing protein
VEGVFNLVYDRLQAFIPYNRIAVALAEEGTGRLSITVCRSDGKMVLGKGYAGQIAGSSLEPLLREGTIRIINDLQDYLEKKPTSESTRLIVREGMRSSLTLPLLHQGKPIGVMFFSSRLPNAYRPEHSEFLRTIVGHMAVAIERTRLVDALREKTEYLENVLQNSADGIIVLDARGRIRTWNEGARQIFGYEASEVVGREETLLIPAEELAAGEPARLEELLRRQGHVKDRECVRLTREGQRITVRVTSTLLRDRQNRLLGRSDIYRNVTHLKKLQQDLLNSQSLAAVGELAATVAHEIKNPLAGISGAIQVLRDAIPEESGRREIISEILDQIRRLDNTVRDLLSYSRPATPSREEMELKPSLAKAWAILHSQPGAAAVRFSIHGGDDVRIHGDSQLLHQVWVNLFQNALEAMPRGGDLTVHVSGDDPIRVEVRDSGSGIDPAHLPRVFKPFFSTKTKGTGLGLAITRKIIEAHGGEIRAESAPRKGTSIFVEIPR